MTIRDATSVNDTRMKARHISKAVGTVFRFTDDGPPCLMLDDRRWTPLSGVYAGVVYSLGLLNDDTQVCLLRDAVLTGTWDKP